MKRQARLSLFFQREQQELNLILQMLCVTIGFYFSLREYCSFSDEKIKLFFKASGRDIKNTDTVFDIRAWPLPHDYIDLIIFDHPFDSGYTFETMQKELMRVLRKEGVAVFTGFNRMRLCARPLRALFRKQICAPKRPCSALKLLEMLNVLGFSAEIRYFDFCRAAFLNKIMGKIFPFLGRGFIIIAKRKTISLNPLADQTLACGKLGLKQAISPIPETLQTDAAKN